MAITQAICNSWKQDILSGIQLLSHEYKIALFILSGSNLSKSTTTYTGAPAEVAEAGGYVTGGGILVGFSVTLDGDTAILDWTTDPVWGPGATITARGALIYNNTLSGKNAVLVLDFGGDYVSTNGNFTVKFPLPAATTGLIRMT